MRERCRGTLHSQHVLLHWCIGKYDFLPSYFGHVWHEGVMVKAFDLQSTGRGFDSPPLRFHVTTLDKLFTHVCLCHQAV